MESTKVDYHARLAWDPGVTGDCPVVKGTTLTTAAVAALVRAGMTWGDIIRAHPDVNGEDVAACLQYEGFGCRVPVPAVAPAPSPANPLVSDQAPPVPNGRPAVWDLVIRDMRDRDAGGLAKYGTRLQPHNGRDVLVDLYQELLDAAVYTRQLIEERSDHAGELRRMIESRDALVSMLRKVRGERDALAGAAAEAMARIGNLRSSAPDLAAAVEPLLPYLGLKGDRAARDGGASINKPESV